jgi:hypothetical protein
VEGSTNISGGIKQLTAGTDVGFNCNFFSSTNWGYYWGVQGTGWQDQFQVFKSKVNGGYSIFYSPAFSSWSFTPSYSGEVGFRVIRIRAGITTIIQSYIFNFTAGTPSSSGSFINPFSVYVDAIPNDIIKLQHKNEYTQMLVGYDTTGTRNVSPISTFSFGQNTIVTSTL